MGSRDITPSWWTYLNAFDSPVAREITERESARLLVNVARRQPRLVASWARGLMAGGTQ